MNESILLDQISKQDVIEWFGLITGIIYVILAVYEKPSCWIFGILSSVAIAWKSFVDYKLIADGFLQIFYVIIGFIGIWNWISGRVGQHEKPITESPFVFHLVAISFCLLLSIPLSSFLIHYAGAKYGFPDTAISLLSICATILLVQKDVHNWIYWIILDIMLMWLYYISGGYLFALLLLIYTLIAIVGFIQWRHQLRIYSPRGGRFG